MTFRFCAWSCPGFVSAVTPEINRFAAHALEQRCKRRCLGRSANTTVVLDRYASFGRPATIAAFQVWLTPPPPPTPTSAVNYVCVRFSPLQLLFFALAHGSSPKLYACGTNTFFMLVKAHPILHVLRVHFASCGGRKMPRMSGLRKRWSAADSKHVLRACSLPQVCTGFYACMPSFGVACSRSEH